MKKNSIIALITLTISSVLLFSCEDKGNKSASKTDGVTLNNNVDSLSYALGISIGNNVKQSGFNDLNADVLAQAIDDVYTENENMSIEDAGGLINTYLTQQAENLTQQAEKQNLENKEKSIEWLQIFEDRSNDNQLNTTESGLKYQIIEEGTGAKPNPTDLVKVHYHGKLLNGKVFDSSIERGQVVEFPLNGVIPGWTEGLQLMKEGGKARFILPPDLAYGESGAGPTIGPNETLEFYIELVKIK